MKKIVATSTFILMMAFGGSVFASGLDVAHCAQMKNGKGVSECAIAMNHGVSECATSPDCPMAK